MTLRPYGLIIGGKLEIGLELVLGPAGIEEIRPHTGIPDDYVISPAFVNAHSHLEYRGMQGRIHENSYWPWIREITRLKKEESLLEVRDACRLAARENRGAGVALIGEHSDRPYAGEAMNSSGLKGIIFQEVITFFERELREEKLAKVRSNADANESFFTPVELSPHAYQTVDRQTLAEIGASGNPFSIHVAETDLENQFTRDGTGDIAEFYRSNGVPFGAYGVSVVGALDGLGLVRQGAQFVHCCAVSCEDIALMASRGVTVAHCPRSNNALGCPAAPVREMLDAGLYVGLGLDSAASSGPIDMFEEMRAALAVSMERGRPLTGDEIWRMSTSMGAASLPIETPVWEIKKGSAVPLLKIQVAGCHSIDEVIDQASAAKVEWVQPMPPGSS